MREHLDTLQVAPELRDWVEGMCCLCAFGPIDQAAATEMFRAVGLVVVGTRPSCWPRCRPPKLLKGTRKLIKSIAAQATFADIRLNSPVRRIVPDR